MGTLLFFACFLVILIHVDIKMRFIYSFSPKNLFEKLNMAQQQALRQILNSARAYTGFKIKIFAGLVKKLPKSFLLISNHQSLADIPIISHAVPNHRIVFVAKKELKYGLPAFSFSLRNAGHALVDRKGDFGSALKALIKLARLTKHGACPIIFPEGTRSRNGKVGSFHSAAIRTILKNARIPVVSVAITGGNNIVSLKDLFTNLRNCVYRVKFLSLYPWTSERKNIQEIIDASQDEISQQVESWKKWERTAK